MYITLLIFSPFHPFSRSLSLSLSLITLLMQCSTSPFSLFLSPSILTRTAHRQHRESFANCVVPTVRKLNERLQLCSRCCNEPRSSNRNCLFYNLLLALQRITEFPLSHPRYFSRLLSQSLRTSLFFRNSTLFLSLLPK